MKAFVMRQIDEVGFEEKERPTEPGPNGAIIKTTRGLICTSDTHTVKGAIGDRHNLTLGHEAVGVVERLGSEVRSLKEGDRVLSSAITPCFHCANCVRGYTSQCSEMLGGWKFANIPMGGTVAIFAQGPVGLMATVGARLLGAGLIIAVETVPRRKQLATHFGADEVVDFKTQDAVQTILGLTDGQGVDSTIEAYGGQATFEMCLKVTRPGGTISNVGYHGDGDYVQIPRQAWGVGMSDKTIRTALCPGGKVRMSRLLRLLELGRVDPSPLTTHTFEFDEIEKAFSMMREKADGMIKPLIKF